jgi:hypothetical protein
MIRGRLKNLESLAVARGYTLESIKPCIVSRDGDFVTVDETHWAYPRKAGLSLGGPGTELKNLLSRIGITATPNCSCNAKARIMDAKGIEWCDSNIDTIVGWLRAEAEKRKLPFVDLAGRLLVKRAIANARRIG